MLKRGSSRARGAWALWDAPFLELCLSALPAGQAKETPQTHIQGWWDAVSTPCLCVPDYFSVFMIVSLGLLSSVQGCGDKGSASKGAGDKSTRENELDLLFSPWKHDWH